jgi:hypothetical protein
MVVFDATFLSVLFYPDAKAPQDLSTNKPVERARDRIEHLVDELSRARQKVIIPTPALSELLVVVGDSAIEILGKINSSPCFKIYPFDEMAAIECAELFRTATKTPHKSRSRSTRTKVKFDYQISAIAVVVRAEMVYTDDADIARILKGKKIKVLGLTDLPTPPAQQMPLYTDED